MLAALLSDREREFLQWLCSDKSYKEIAAAMYVSPRTIDGYRDTLLKKINVSSRIGLVTFAIRQGIVVL
jgi:DNA-binding CsgD family transcriptional regulator